jgi:hypothetical protein
MLGLTIKMISVSVLVYRKWSDTGLDFSPEYFNLPLSFIKPKVIKINVILETTVLYSEGLWLESRWVYWLLFNDYVFFDSVPELSPS